VHDAGVRHPRPRRRRGTVVHVMPKASLKTQDDEVLAALA
jgi:hypothetical protein